MLVRTVVACAVAASTLVVPATATAALDVTRDAATGAIRATASGDVTERVTISRADDGSLRFADATAPVTASDASCIADAANGTVSCTTTAGQAVELALGGGADELDARGATGIALRVDAGPGADRLRVGSSGMTTSVGTDALDTYDLSHADAGATGRYEAAAKAVVVRCGGCEGGWSVTLPAQPKAVLLGTGDDDIDLRAWSVRGHTAWTTGAGRDRAIGSRIRRSTFTTGADPDVLLSWAPADRLLGGPGTDKIGDFGGAGDVLDGGPDIDIMASLDRARDTMRGGAGRDMCPSLFGAMRTCDSSGRVSGFEMNLYLPLPTQNGILRGVLGVYL